MLGCASFGQDKPLPVVDELSRGVEMTGVTCGLRHDMEDDLPQAVQSPIPEEVGWPQGRCGIQGNVGDDGIRTGDFLTVCVEDALSGNIRIHDPGIGDVVQVIEDGLLTGDDAAEPESLDVEGEMLDQSQA